MLDDRVEVVFMVHRSIWEKLKLIIQNEEMGRDEWLETTVKNYDS